MAKQIQKEDNVNTRLSGHYLKIFFGFCLFCASVVGMFYNDLVVAHNYEANENSKTDCVEAYLETIDKANNGKLVYVAGQTECDEEIKDDRFKVKVKNSIRLYRKVEVFQWVETTKMSSEQISEDQIQDTKGFYYDAKWVSDVIDSSKFMFGEGHDNYLKALPFKPAVFYANKVKLGAYELDGEQLKTVGESEWAYLDEETVEVPEGAIFYNDTIYYSPQIDDYNKKELAKARANGGEVENYCEPDPEKPIIGDIKITFRTVVPPEVTILANQKNNWLGSSKDDPIQTFEIRNGIIPKKSFFKLEEGGNTTSAWLARLGCAILSFLGLYLIFAPLTRIGDFVAFFKDFEECGTALLCGMFTVVTILIAIGCAWVSNIPIMSSAMFVCAVVLLVLIVSLLLKARKIRLAAAAKRKAFLATKAVAK